MEISLCECVHCLEEGSLIDEYVSLVSDEKLRTRRQIETHLFDSGDLFTVGSQTF